MIRARVSASSEKDKSSLPSSHPDAEITKQIREVPSIGKHSYGGAGPAIVIDVEEQDRAGSAERKVLKGVRIFASRYGVGYDPGTESVRLIVRQEDRTLARCLIPYSRFSYEPQWIDWALPKQLTIDESKGALTVCLQPDANRYKGIYFHYARTDSGGPRSAVSSDDGKTLRPLADRQWMIRPRFVSQDARAPM